MTDHDALLRAILAEPADDTVRLAYADYLEEHGQEARAEFIRVQCELAAPHPSARHPGHPQPDHLSFCRRCRNLRRREGELLRNLYVVLTTGLPHGFVNWGSGAHGYTFSSIEYVFRRGFVEAVTLTAADWLAHADEIYWHPDQRVPCWVCKGNGHGLPFGVALGCTTCKREGTVPRPFVPTAQPIREVRLTTWPGETAGWPATPTLWHPALTELEFYEWPGVRFHLPRATA